MNNQSLIRPAIVETCVLFCVIHASVHMVCVCVCMHAHAHVCMCRVGARAVLHFFFAEFAAVIVRLTHFGVCMCLNIRQ